MRNSVRLNGFVSRTTIYYDVVSRFISWEAHTHMYNI